MSQSHEHPGGFLELSVYMPWISGENHIREETKIGPGNHGDFLKSNTFKKWEKQANPKNEKNL